MPAIPYQAAASIAMRLTIEARPSDIVDDDELGQSEQVDFLDRLYGPIVLQHLLGEIEVGAESDAVGHRARDPLEHPPETAAGEVIEDEDHAVLAANAAHLGHQPYRIRRDREHVGQDDEVEAGVGESEAFAVHLAQATVAVRQLVGALPGALQHAGRD